MLEKQLRRLRRHKKIRARIHGSQERPRLFVFRSQNHIYAQLINDDKAIILLSASDKEIKETKTEEKVKSGRKVNASFEVGKLIAKKAIAKSIEKVVFDRGGIIFHGRVKALADGAREGGLKF
ncbi:MAG: 50S ribosomal protein L18 [bacterium]|nr:50S ribosomal protein L18 [bacterium]